MHIGVKILFFIFSCAPLCAEGLRCMLMCSSMNCKNPERFLWCATQCSETLGFGDLQRCAASFSKEGKQRGFTCKASLAPLVGSCSGVDLFCTTVEGLLLSAREEPGYVLMSLLTNAMHNVPTLRSLQEKVASLGPHKVEVEESE